MKLCTQIKRASLVLDKRTYFETRSSFRAVRRLSCLKRTSVTSLDVFGGVLCTSCRVFCNVLSGTVHHSGAGKLALRRPFQTTMVSKGNQKTIQFQEYDAFGFDLDHTIAKYKLVELFNLAYKCVTSFMVNERGYDPSIKGDLHKYKDFICKGLFLDVSRGNILKLGHDGTVLRATHGTQLLSKSQVQAVYGKDMKWDQTDTVRKTLRNMSPQFRFFENYFDCPALVATARIIEIIDEKTTAAEEKEKMYTKAWKDALDSLHYMYDPDNFSAEKGGFFAIVKQDARKFVEECSADIRQWLQSLRQEGKIVFLLTSSQIDYASCLLEVCLGENWKSYFDISLFRGRKPGFFTDNNPFCALENHREGAEVSDLQRDGCYSQGNIDGFNKFLAKELGKDDIKVVYFGDNICSDCFPSKHFAQWSTVLILEEMDAEGYVCSDDTVPGQKDDDNGAVESSSKKRKALQHSSLVTVEEIDHLITEFWGPFLVHEGEKSACPVPTFWSDVIVQYSDIAVPSLEYLAGVPLDHRFERFCGNGTDTAGYHPGPPSSLLP